MGKIEDDILGLGQKAKITPPRDRSPRGSDAQSGPQRFEPKAFLAELAKRSGDMKVEEWTKDKSAAAPPDTEVVERVEPVYVGGRAGLSNLNASIDRLGDRVRDSTNLRPIFVAPAINAERCKVCDDRGYVVRGQGDWAKASLCNCSPICETCRGHGHIFSRDKGYEYMKVCPDCAALKERIALFNYAHVPALFADKFLDVFEPRASVGEAWQFLLNYCKKFPQDTRGVLLVGPPGLGKTHLMVGVIRKLTLEKGVRCMFKDFFLLLSELKEAYETGRFQSDIMRPLGDVDVLVVDELGKGRNTEWEINLLDEIVCKRYNRHKTTLFTTNFPLVGTAGPTPRNGRGNLSRGAEGTPSLGSRVSDRVLSRLQEMCTVIEVGGADYRAETGANLSKQRGRRS